VEDVEALGEVSAAELQDREDPFTTHASDARHWIAIYQERIALYGDLLERARQVEARTGQVSETAAISRDVALLEAQLRRSRERLEFWYARHWALEGLQLDALTRMVTHRERSIPLTGREFQLLETLAHRTGTYVRAQQLLVEAWRDSRLPEETLRTYIVRLRAKLAQLGAGARIVNRPRRGYALVFDGQGGQDGQDGQNGQAGRDGRNGEGG
jgi:DNA-binding winged helix-turn-helix (wHTH) protein